jgi:diguanylate cyclase (GGDEF)-like protein
MANYRALHGLTNSHLAFSVAFELQTFDPESESASHAFATQLRIRGHSGERDSDFASYVQNQLMPRGLVASSGSYYEVTPEGRVWGEVCRLRADGTLIMFGETVDAEAWPTFDGALREARSNLKALAEQIEGYLGSDHTPPRRLKTLVNATHALHEAPKFPDSIVSLQMYRDAAVLACREKKQRLQERKEKLELRARDRRVLTGVLSRVEHLDGILALASLASALTVSKPRVTDFVNIGIIEEASGGRATDEKFGILSAPYLFSTDFPAAAKGAFSRDRSFAVGFVDIDDFKQVNNTHGETSVDQNILPNFMRALEAYCYGRAYAYRQGGDEYLVLLLNADSHEAKSFFEGLRAHVAAIPYPIDLQSKPTVSIGVHVIDGNHEATVFEAQQRANEAKNLAKKSGKNRVHLSTDPPPQPMPAVDPIIDY